MYKSIALVDLSCLFKRTFEANPNAGAKNTLEEIVRIDGRVEHMILCLDAPPYSRKQVFPDYKAHRDEPTTTEVYQKRWLYEQLKERGYPMARHEGAEADDVIATLARVYGESTAEVWLVGADKDLAQCVTDNVLQLIPKHGERAEHFRGPKEVREKFGVTPDQMPLFLALVGDKSDNIPGVKGIGQVKAAGLISEFKTLAGIAEGLPRIGGQVAKALADGWNQLVLSTQLTLLDARLPLDAQALLAKAEPPAPAEPEPEFVGNETPMPEVIVVPPHHDEKLAPDAAFDEMVAKGSRPEPIIGEDPRAKEFLRQQHAERNADRAAREQQERELEKEREQQDARRERIADSVQAAYRGKREDALRTADYVMNPGTLPRPEQPAPSAPPPAAPPPVESVFEPSPPREPLRPPPPPAPAPRVVASLPGPAKARLRGLALLRAPFEKHQISKLPKGSKDQMRCPPSEKRSCNVCGGWHHPKCIHLDYVGHAALTDRLLECDPAWAWEPMAFAANGLPLFDPSGGLWIRLTVCGVTRLGYGHAPIKEGQDPGAREKEVIGDALRNAAMRFGAALDLWHKGEDLHGEDWDPAASWLDSVEEVA